MTFLIRFFAILAMAQQSFADFKIDTSAGGRETFQVTIEPASKKAILTWSLQGSALASRAIPLSLALDLQRDLAVHFGSDTIDSNNTINCTSKMVISFQPAKSDAGEKNSVVCLSGLRGEQKRIAKESLRTIRQLASRKSL